MQIHTYIHLHQHQMSHYPQYGINVTINEILPPPPHTLFYLSIYSTFELGRTLDE